MLNSSSAKSYRVGPLVSSGETVATHRALLRGPLGFERPVLLHWVHPHLSSNPPFARALAARLSILGRARHPNLLAIEDFGWRRAQLFLVTPPVSGNKLHSLLERLGETRRGLSVSASCYIAFELADAFEALHAAAPAAAGPAESAAVFLCSQGRITWLDRCFRLGPPVSCIRGIPDRGSRRPRHLAPECARGAAGDRRSDVYSLCSLLLEMVGVRAGPAGSARKVAPFERSFAEVLERGLSSDPQRRPPLSELMACISKAEPSALSAGRAELIARLKEPSREDEVTNPAEPTVEATTAELGCSTAANRARAAAPSVSVLRPAPAGVWQLNQAIAPLPAMPAEASRVRRPPQARPGLGRRSVAAASLVLDGGREPGRLILSGPAARWVVGRSQAADLVLNDPDVSREHFEILRRADGTLWAFDLGSKNGLTVNGREVNHHRLSKNDQIVAGNSSLRFCDGSDST